MFPILFEIFVAVASILAIAYVVSQTKMLLPYGMVATAFADLINKSPVYSTYMAAMLPEKIELVRSGVATINPDASILNAFSVHGGKTFSIPFYKEIAQSNAEIPTANTNATVRAMTTGADIGVVLARVLAMGSEDIAAIFAGTDPMVEVSRQMSNFWGRQIDTSLVKVLVGALGAVTTNVLSTHSGDEFAPEFIIEGADLLGDSSENLGIIIMHSKVAHKLQKANLLTYPNAQLPGQQNLLIQGVMGGRTVFVTDQCPLSGGVYSTYLLGRGAMSIFYQKNLTLEGQREALLAGGTDILVSTMHWVSHLNLVKWTGTASGTTPSFTELATTSNWATVAGNVKDIKAVEIKSTATL